MSAEESGAGKPFLALQQKILVFVLSFLTACAAEGFNSFQLATQHDNQSAFLSSMIVGWAPAAFTTATERDAFGPVSVFVVDQSMRDHLKDEGRGFDTPFVPYDVQAQYIEDVLGVSPDAPNQRASSDHPAAIFLDFIYNRDSSDAIGLTHLIEAVKKANSLGVKVYTGPIIDSAAMAAFAREVHVVSVNWTFEHPLDYPIYGQKTYHPDGVTPPLALTAAARIYRDLCREHLPISQASQGANCGMHDALALDTLSPAPAGANGEAVALARALPPLMPIYIPYQAGSGSPYGALCGQTRNLAFDIRTSLTALARAVFPNLGVAAYSKCLNLPHFSLYELQRYGTIQSAHDTFLPYIKGKVVMIGDGLGNDRITVPVFGQVDGVIQHAVALRTLLARGETYIRWPGRLSTPGGTFSLGLDFILEWGVSLCVLVLAQRILYNVKEGQKGVLMGSRLVMAGLGAVGLSIGLVLFVTMMSLWLGIYWPPMNLVSVLLPTLGLFTVMELDKVLARDWKRLILTLAVVLLLAGIAGLALVQLAGRM